MSTDVDRANSAKRPAVSPTVPLMVLESVREHDRPTEILEDEDVAASLPRRLGLSEVVNKQIHRYETAARQGRSIPADEVGNLLRLVLRRPDAATILAEAGRRIARESFERKPDALITVIRALPGHAVASLAARRAAGRLLRRLVGARLDFCRSPLAARLSGSLLTDVDGTGAACAFYTAVIEETLTLYHGEDSPMDHSLCLTRGDERCEWVPA